MNFSPNRGFSKSRLATALLLIAGGMVAANQASAGSTIIKAKRVFDGDTLWADASPTARFAVLVTDNKIVKLGPAASVTLRGAKIVDLGESTILPGFIESHAHMDFQNINKDAVLAHGITTVQDTGGPAGPAALSLAPTGGQGKLRVLRVGPILQAPGVDADGRPLGYPSNIFGGSDGGGIDQIGWAVNDAADGVTKVHTLLDKGASAIKIALEPGGETGAPWMQPHGDLPVPAAPWPILPPEVTDAIVHAAHTATKPVRVIAHVGEENGFVQALNSGVDEFAHMPCGFISDTSLARAASVKGLTFVTTLDTLASCAETGMHFNAFRLAGMIAKCEADNGAGNCAKVIYGSEIGHDNVPWGVNGEEMHWILHLTNGMDGVPGIGFVDVLNVFRSVTSKAGERLGLDPRLGRLVPGAPADVIAVKDNLKGDGTKESVLDRFKLAEYPSFVMSGGVTVVGPR